MSESATLSLSLIFAVIAMIGTLINIANTFKSNTDKETEKRLDIEKQFVRVNDKLDTVSQHMAELIRRDEANMSEIKRINETLILQNERLETLFRYKDEHERRLKSLEIKRRNHARG